MYGVENRGQKKVEKGLRKCVLTVNINIHSNHSKHSEYSKHSEVFA
ncbi:hypothetical protein ABH899_004533 [Paenibacillus sp. RC84]